MRTGKCMCGAVSLTIRSEPDTFNACACDMCRRLTGSQFMSVWVPFEDVTIKDAAQVRTIQSSDWAERGFCGACGSSLWYRPTGGEPGVGLSLGLFDDLSGLAFDGHWYTDKAICALLNQPPKSPMTEAEVDTQFESGSA
ncbi:GFA family protein [Roseovarius sp. LXJ103]|uniref:GFA family protein n=1 Tax=Roseovarius carneus TaxID=2853164 RepID=UPI000D61A96D|nr:GFA family protein [Roseovarius carneus]MBZ8118327.1 GFA family protein [Roseovarius carneus]PWE35957.1 aldehyde-activating protein [Pelagicola sp. LXJ1103]